MTDNNYMINITKFKLNNNKLKLKKFKINLIALKIKKKIKYLILNQFYKLKK
jgi:hypothetical protein